MVDRREAPLRVRAVLPLVCLVALLTSCASVGGPQSEGDSGADTRGSDRGGAEHQVIAILKKAPPSLWRREAAELAESFSIRVAVAWEVPSLDSPCVVYEVPRDRSIAEVSEKLQRDHRVQLAQPVNVFRLLQRRYNDAHYDLQHGAHSIKVQEAHRWSTGKGVTVAVVDSGVDTSHPDLEGRVVWSQDFVETAGQDLMDVHGTAMVGVIAAKANNQEGIVGVAPDAQVLALRACWQTASGSREALCSTYTLIQAIDLAIRARARVINLSLAGPEDPILARLLARAVEVGITVVAAVDEEKDSGPGFPASLEGVLAVGTADPMGTAEGETRFHHHTELVAPGIDILTTVPGPGYDFLSGSSLAAAHTSGVVALILELQPDLSPSEIGVLIRQTAHQSPIGLGSSKLILSVDACAAVAELVDGGNCS